MLIDTQAIDFGTVMTSDEILESITITNIGNEILTGSISATNSFTIAEARANASKNEILATHKGLKSARNLDFTLATGVSKSYDVSHSTTLAGLYEGELLIISNDPENSEISIPLALEVINPASITVNHQRVELTMQTNQTADRSMIISNGGDLDLNCSLTLQSEADRDLFEIS